jgi:hypothetical protein
MAQCQQEKNMFKISKLCPVLSLIRAKDMLQEQKKIPTRGIEPRPPRT